MRYIVDSPPTDEAIPLAHVKKHLRTLPGDNSEDEAILIPMITAAREYCENITGRTLARITATAYPEAFDLRIDLPHMPVNTVESITYTDADGNIFVLPPEKYIVDGKESIIIIKEFPDFSPAGTNPIQIRYTAGYDADTLPRTIRQAMLLLIGHWYSNRETVVVGAIAAVEVKMTTKRLLDQWKVWWF